MAILYPDIRKGKEV